MTGSYVSYLEISIYRQIFVPDGGSIVLADPRDDRWSNLHLANHNIFRFDSKYRVIWQVSRVENGYVNWEIRNLHAKEDDPTCEGYLDPFIRMGDKFFERRALPYKE
jgi:hypothetical protein